MPIPSPLHSRTQNLCDSYFWKDWAGYYAVKSYGTSHEREYYAFRHGSGIIDLSPLFKYKIKGPGAKDYLNQLLTRSMDTLKVGRIGYTCWCDDHGHMIDDGTVMNMGDDCYYLTAAIPSMGWLSRYDRGYDVEITDISEDFAIIGVQGPTSRDLLKQACDAPLDDQRFFSFVDCNLDTNKVILSRTGYTGDLGYEIWVNKQQATQVWDSLFKVAPNYGGIACGLDALDVTRIEAGFIMNGVDYHSAHHCPIEARKSTPYEAGLGWTVHLKKEFFNGHEALRKQKADGGPKEVLVAIEYDWNELEFQFRKLGLPPEICNAAWRTSIPLYDTMNKQIGYCSSGTWSPLLKKNIALATIKKKFAKPGTKIKIELTVEHKRKVISAYVRKNPMLDLERKTYTPNIKSKKLKKIQPKI